jgi:hypothetical protein
VDQKPKHSKAEQAQARQGRTKITSYTSNKHADVLTLAKIATVQAQGIEARLQTQAKELHSSSSAHTRTAAVQQ